MCSDVAQRIIFEKQFGVTPQGISSSFGVLRQFTFTIMRATHIPATCLAEHSFHGNFMCREVALIWMGGGSG